MSASPARLHRPEKIDILIPAIEKDLSTLPYVIDGLRQHVRHPIGSIYIVSPQSPAIRRLCSRKQCTFVDERTVLPLTKKDIVYRSKKWDRSGWLYQQLLKLNGDQIAKAAFYLVVDADTVFIRPHTFRRQDKTVFYTRNWSQPEYFRTYRKLMGHQAPSPRSFVTHYMLFEKARVRELKKDIETRHGTVWYRAILRSIDRTKQFGFSEFETYANYMYTRNPNQMMLKPSLNKALHTSAKMLTGERRTQLARKYRSLSFHERKIYRRTP
ncbi:DUF6492 family protein [Paenibacillus sp. JX-17]|uniref:DUF6492 family protein n=1 Tax=Paenibacillus lacisoli TaxID=3064525 RepID=A0ABT9CG81_9BACL|nr:DUF6492 family protein [Paenibacillus sp. JX-17]